PLSNPSQGDPAQSLAVAVEQYRRNYIFLAPSDYNTNYADIVLPAGATATLDGAQINQMPTAIGTSGYGVVRIKLGAGNAGAHTLTTSAPSGLQIMGYGSYTSYQYPGGLDLTAISTAPKDTL